MGSFVIYGNEPWIMRRQKAGFKSKCNDPVYGYQEFDDIWDARDFLTAFNLFTDTVYAYLRVPDTKELAGKEYLKFLGELKNSTNKYLLVEVEKATEKDKGLAKIKEVATSVIAYPKITQAPMLWQQLDVILSEQNAKMDENAKKVLVDRLDYFHHEATNLITIENYISQLKYLGEWITVDDIVRNTPDLREAERFKLASFIAQGKVAKVLDEAARLKSERDFNVFGLLGILFKEYKVSYLAKLGYSVKQQNVFMNNMKNLEVSELVEGMNIISQKLADVRTGVYSEEEAFDIALTELICLKK